MRGARDGVLCSSEWREGLFVGRGTADRAEKHILEITTKSF